MRVANKCNETNGTIGPSPNEQEWFAAPPCCVHRDLTDAEPLAEAQGHLLSLQEIICTNLQHIWIIESHIG